MQLISRADARSARRRLPLQIPPTLIANEYARALIRLLTRAENAYKPLLHELPALLAPERSDGRFDAASGAAARVRRLARAAAEETRKAIRDSDIEALARKFGAQTSTHQRVQLGRQVKAALGVDPILKEPGLAQASTEFLHENVALIRTIPERLHGDVEALVQRAVSSSQPSPKLAKHIEERFGVGHRHARLIARDQISKYSSKLNHARQKELGVEKFVWRSMSDERVRDWHRDELDGNTYSYAKPPDNEDGEPVLPGDDIQCRCYAEGIFD